jgi:multicomponent Na+:H+ antiporter subunit A
MDPQLPAVLAAVLLPFVAAAAMPLIYRLVGDTAGYVGAGAAAVAFALVASQHGRQGSVAVSWVPSRDISLGFYVDGWALLFALLASGIGVLIFTYAGRYMHGKPDLGRFYMSLSAFLGSILGVAFASDLVALFLFWELTSVCSFVLIGYYTDDETSIYSARMAMLVTVGGGLCLLAAILLLSVASGPALGGRTFDLALMLAEPEAMRAELTEAGLFVPTLVLVAVAAGAKSAQVPLHFWLPNAMVAPTPVSAFLHSATMVKVGVYVLGRTRPLFIGEEWTMLLAAIGLLTMTVGAVLAVVATDIKELLAYSTASHLGLMVAGFGFSTHYGAEAGAFHLLNHALFKAALFLVAGVVAHEAGTRRLDELGGLRSELPITAAIAVVTGLSMAGVPPFNGFYSKELLFEAAWETAVAAGGLAWLYPAVAVFASIFTVLYSLRFLSIFFGDQPETAAVAHRPSVLLVAPPALLAVAAAVVSVAPGTALDFIVNDAASATTLEPVDIHAGIPTSLSGPVLMSGLALAIGGGTYPFSERVRTAIAQVESSATLLEPAALYADLLEGLDTASSRLDAVVHNGLLRTYVTWALGTACGLTLLGYWVTAVQPSLAGPRAPAALLLVLAVAVVAALAVTIAPSHVAGVLTLGILGFMVAVFYVLASGPDLALTQLVVETLLLLIFLLIIEELPAFYSEVRPSVAVRDIALSVLVGTTAFVSVLIASPDQALTETSRYYVDNAVPEGGGTNIVNVILTDFRAFDTLGESAVVLLAALSVLVLLEMRNRGETR